MDTVTDRFTSADELHEAGDGIKAGAARWTFGGDVARSFDGHVSKSVPLYTQGHEITAGLSEFFIKGDSVCYELGCSTGTLVGRLARKHADLTKARFVGLDIEDGMIAHARQRHADAANLAFQVADITEFDFERSDLVVAYYTVQFIHPKSRQKLFSRIFNALNQGGGFILFEKTRANDARFQDIFSIIYNQFKLDQGYNAAEILSKTMSLKGVLQPFSTQENTDLLTNAGFKEIICVQKYLSFEGLLAVK